MKKFNNNIKTLAPRINTANNATIGLDVATNFGLGGTLGTTSSLGIKVGRRRYSNNSRVESR